MSHTILKFIVLTIFIIGIFVSNTMQHEKVHKAIYEDYGINADIHYTWLSGLFSGRLGYTQAYITNNTCPNECMLANEYNEIIGYNVSTLVTAICGAMILWLFVTEVRSLDNE
jgi:hypothetical protein